MDTNLVVAIVIVAVIAVFVYLNQKGKNDVGSDSEPVDNPDDNMRG